MGHARRVIFDLVCGQLARAAVRDLTLTVEAVQNILGTIMEWALYEPQDVVPHLYFAFPLPNTLALMDSQSFGTGT